MSYLDCIEQCLEKFEDSLEFVTAKINNRKDQLNSVVGSDGRKQLTASEKAFFTNLKNKTIADTIPIILEDVECVLQDIFDALDREAGLVSDTLPELINPTSSITVEVVSGDPAIIGSTIAVLIRTTFNRGRIQPAFGTNGYRSGEMMSFTITGPGHDQVLELNSATLVNITVTENDLVWTLDVNVAEGEQPLSAGGVEHSSPYGAGALPQATATLPGGTVLLESWFATMNGLNEGGIDKDISQEFVELGRVDINDLIEIDETRLSAGEDSYRYIPLQITGILYPDDNGYTGTGPQYKYGFQIPVSWGEIDMVATNWINNWVRGSAWDTNNTSQVLNISTETIDVDGVSRPYYQVLRRNEGSNPDPTFKNIRIYFKED